MFKYFTAALLSLCLTAPAFALEPPATAKANPQTDKMRTCAQEYHQRSIPKAEYRKFMSFCLKKDYVSGSYVLGTTAAPASVPSAAAPAATTAPTPAASATQPVQAAEPALTGREKQKNKMKTCNSTAKEKGLKGAERKEFMKTCLSAD